MTFLFILVLFYPIYSYKISLRIDLSKIIKDYHIILKMVYTLEERIEIVFIYGEKGQCARRTAATFKERYPGKNVSHTYVIQLIKKFKETGCVINKKTNQPKLINEAAQIEIMGHFAMNPTSSIWQVSATTGISVGSVHKILKLNKFHPYKIQPYQKLLEEDFDRRIQFCEEMTAIINITPNLVQNICFSDECTFFVNGEVNRHNCRYWSEENPHLFRESHTQWPEKINVWAGILGNNIIGPLFFEENLTGNLYLNLLDDVIDPLITDSLENQTDENGNSLLNEELLHFQHDGAPPHYVLPVRQWLDNHFLHKWIGRRGAIEWPPRSPDLTPLDFFLWGHLKSVVYKTPVENINDLRRRIVQECKVISVETFRNVRLEFENRLYYCLENNGKHFEYLLQ